MNRIRGLFKLLRFELPVSAGICVIMGQLLSLGGLASLTITLYGFFSVFAISAAILVLNDIIDIETDKINAPSRPLPSKSVTIFEAALLTVILFLTGLILSFIINITAFVVVIILAVIGILYNRFFKKNGIFGNLMVSFSVGMTFIYGGITVGSIFNKTVLLFGIIAALIDLGEEIAADAMDVKGDLLIQSNSLAIKHGRKFALRTSFIIFLSVVLISWIPFILNWFSLIYLIPIAIIDISIAYPAYKLLKSDELEGRKLIRVIYLGSTFGLIVFLIMRLAGL